MTSQSHPSVPKAGAPTVEVDMATAIGASAPSPQETTGHDPAAVRRAAWAGLIGTTLEQYDFVIYGTASALVFSKLFFPNISPTAALLASFTDRKSVV